MCKAAVLVILFCALCYVNAIIGGTRIPESSRMKPNITYSGQYAVDVVNIRKKGIPIKKEHVYFHPNYTNYTCMDFDIAVISIPSSDLLIKPVPIELCPEYKLTDDKPILISWLNHSATIGPHKLNYADISILEASQCNNSFKFLENHHICASSFKNPRGSNGDSGGPLINPTEFCQVGIYYCTVQDYMGFINISYFNCWIDKIIEHHEENTDTATEGTTAIACTYQTKTDIEATFQTETTTDPIIKFTSETLSTTQRTETSTQSTCTTAIAITVIVVFICGIYIIIKYNPPLCNYCCRIWNRLQLLRQVVNTQTHTNERSPDNQELPQMDQTHDPQQSASSQEAPIPLDVTVDSASSECVGGLDALAKDIQGPEKAIPLDVTVDTASSEYVGGLDALAKDIQGPEKGTVEILAIPLDVTVDSASSECVGGMDALAKDIQGPEKDTVKIRAIPLDATVDSASSECVGGLGALAKSQQP